MSLHFRRPLPKKVDAPTVAGVKEGIEMLIWIIAGSLLAIALALLATEFRSHHHQ
jgi:hypothetical protein